MFHLKLARRIVSTIFFVMTCLSVWFLLPQQWSQHIVALQFGPATIQLTSGLAGWTFLSIVTLGLIVVGFGRIYCSTICPLGFLQDVSIWFGKILGIKHNWEIIRKKQLKILRIGILAITALLLVAGSAFAAGLLEPFSIFSRFLFLLKILLRGSVHGSVLPLLFIAATTFVIVLPAALKGRFFCSWLCPVGTLLWGLSKLSLFKFRINQKACNHCNKCIASCKAAAISVKEKQIDPALCVGCFNCMSVCNQHAIMISPERINTKREKLLPENDDEIREITANKRKFIKQLSSVLFVMNIPLSVISSNEWKGILSGKEQLFPVFPPGAMDLKRFKSTCTGCMLCAQKCPSKIITPSMGPFDGSPVLPVLNFQDNYCLEDCVVCSQVCPSGALQKVREEDKKITKMAALKLDLTECLIVAEGLECAICAEICPLHAIEMKRIPGQKFKVPVVIQNICNGCGKCQYRCPAIKRKEIFRFTL